MEMRLLFSVHIIAKTMIKDKLKVKLQWVRKQANIHTDTKLAITVEAHKWQHFFLVTEYILQLNVKIKGDSDRN